MQTRPTISCRIAGTILATIVVATLGGCAGTAPSPVSGTTAPQDRSPLATPPSSMMTPHGY